MTDAIPERIVAVAIQLGGVTFSLPRPARHHTVMHSLDLYLSTQDLAASTQGFVTSEGRFVNRCQARQIAHLSGQEPKTTGPAHELYSEDLW